MTNYFILHTGGLGDLVLASALVAGLRGAGRRIWLATREDVGRIVALFPEQPDEWVALPFNPHACGGWSNEWAALVEEFSKQVRELRIDVFVEATLRPTWFGPMAAAAVGAGRNVHSGFAPPGQPAVNWTRGPIGDEAKESE